MSTRILLAHDHDVVRAGLRGLLEKSLDIQIVGEAEDGRAAILLCGELMPDILIMDIVLPLVTGIEVMQQARQRSENTKIIIVSKRDDKELIEQAIQAGASAYLFKDSGGGELLLAVKEVLRGRTYLSPRIADVVVQQYIAAPSRARNGALSHLSPRERQVLGLIAEGKTSREIATSLSIRTKTVESHRAQLMGKLNLRSVAELTKYAIRVGLSSAEASSTVTEGFSTPGAD